MSLSVRGRKVTVVVSEAICVEVAVMGDAGDHLMGSAGEEAEHSGGVGGVGRLAEGLVVEGYGGVGGQDGEGFRKDSLRG